ncbi:MAG: hypothetical protein ACD_5C00315G0004 [uncultured bacterium]|nr:MAG: hypothetical protein ACD_5C00315G0004 [uncultured bacterium]KKQ46289.1 MAG: GDSL-like protein [Candidatus Moranbacteria bacterium GW2011_GWC2_37_8]KKQ63207.1 MAG: GDSL-like protein [Parcubacteria group bacterium GW2011_GWC1_38_22]
MNTNPNTKRILCFGDSNTWGQNPGGGRYPANVRWTGILQNLLGGDFEIIEEGLGGRTTVYDRPDRQGRNGKTYLLPCVVSQSPFDMVIMSLGTNDFKNQQIDVEDVVNGNEELIKIIREYGWNKDSKIPQLVLVCVPSILESEYTIDKGMGGAKEKIEKLPLEIKKLAEKYNAEFVNLQEIVKPSEIDGCHLEAAEHKKIADALYKICIKI